MQSAHHMLVINKTADDTKTHKQSQWKQKLVDVSTYEDTDW